MVLEVVISESTINIILMILIFVLIVGTLIIIFKLNPMVATFIYILIFIIFATWFIQWAWGNYIAPLYSITVVP